MTCKRFASWIAVAAIPLVFAAASQAQVDKKEAADWSLSADIVSIDLAGKMLNLQEKGNVPVVAVKVDAETTIMKGDAKIGLADLKEGWHVSVDGDERNGSKVATYIEVEED